MSYKAMFLSPMIPSYDLAGTAAFFTDLLGFDMVMDTATYCIVRKDHLTVHLLRAGIDVGQMECYLEVDDLDTLWARINDRLDGLSVRPPFDREYGMREMHIGIPHTNALLFIGEEVRR